MRDGDVRTLGYEILERSVSGMYSGNIEGFGIIAIKRAAVSAVMYLQGEPIVDDICLVLPAQNEEVPEGYVALHFEEKIIKSRFRTSKPVPKSLNIIFCYHQRPAMGLCDLSYESITIDRYPQKVVLLTLNHIYICINTYINKIMYIM